MSEKVNIETVDSMYVYTLRLKLMIILLPLKLQLLAFANWFGHMMLYWTLHYHF